MHAHMIADPQFQAQARSTAEQLKKDGELPNLFQFAYYANSEVHPHRLLPHLLFFLRMLRVAGGGASPGD